MRALSLKLWRDLRTLAGPALAVALVVASGVMAFVALRGAYASVETARDRFYARTRFPDLFAHLVRAPRGEAQALAEVPGVETVLPRLAAEVVLDVPGMAEPARGVLLSLPDEGAPRLGALHLRAGRMPEPGRLEEVVLGEAFAVAHHLSPGARLAGTLGGRRVALQVVGVAVSPEHVYVVPPGSMWPDDRRYGVLWARESPMAAALGFTGAFNDLAVALTPDADVQAVKAELDRRLARHGSLGVMDRSQQLSDRFVAEELRGLDTQTLAVPLIFLGVSALVLHLVLSRLVDSQRETLALLKAVGYGEAAIAWHYLSLALVVVLAGAALGVAGGRAAGDSVVEIYRDFFRFDELTFVLPRTSALLAVLLSVATGVVGALSAVRRVLALQPAEAMQPPAPPPFSRGLVERLHAQRLLGPRLRMVARQVTRRPVRSALTLVGLSLAVGVLVVATAMEAAVTAAIDRQFLEASREDAEVLLLTSRPRLSSLGALARLPGVLRVEPSLTVPVRVRNGHRRWEGALEGRPAGAELRRLLDEQGHGLPPTPPDGVVLTLALAERLEVARGAEVEVERLDGDRRAARVRVAGYSQEGVGLHAQAELPTVQRLFSEPDVINGALLVVEPRQRDELAATLKTLPGVAGVSFREAALETFRRLMARSYSLTRLLLGFFAALMAVGIVYNAGRIALAERSRELATLRVLGFTAAEVSALFLGEQLALVAVAQPVGWGAGWLLTWALLKSVSVGDLFRLTVTVPPSTFWFASGVVLSAAVATALWLRRRIDRLDLVAVLKARE